MRCEIAFLFLVPLSVGAATPTITEYSVPTANSEPWGIAAGPDGAIWFTEDLKIGRISTSGVITEYPVAAGINYLNSIAAGPDGALWFATGQGSKIGRISTTGTMTLYPAPNGGNANNQIVGIVAGSDGALWFTEAFANKIGRITTAGVVTEYAAPGSEPWSIVSGPDGALWFTEQSDIGRISTAGVTSKYAVPTSNSEPWGLAVGSDNNIWFTEEFGGKIGRITTAGVITEYPVNSTGNDISGITSGPDGALWFSDSGANKIGQITTAGVVTEYAIATAGAGPRLLVAGPDGAIWFTEQISNKIGRVAVSPGGGTASGPITVTNPGFETLPSNPQWIDCSGTGGAGSGGPGCRDTADGNIPGWTASNTTSIGLFQPGPNYFSLPLPAAEGQTTASINGGSLSQTLSATMQPSTVYTLQVDVGRRLDNLYPSPAPTVQLFAGTALIASATGAQPPLGGWTTWTGTYQSSSVAAAGQNLKIVLSTIYPEGNFDNVRLTAAPAGTTGNLFTYNGFASTAGLTLVGNAATASTSDGTVLRLTAATGNQSGAAYSTTPVTLGNNATFSAQFQFRFTNPGGWDPADGITFVLGTSTTGLGNSGAGIGYQGVGGKSVAIEFDTYNNTGYGLGNDDGNSSNHVAIDTNGTLTNTDVTNVYKNGSCGFSSGTPAQNLNTVAGCMSNGHLWTANINYDGSKLTVTLTDPAEGSSFTAISGYAINLASLLGQNTAFVGFTAGTGAGWENHDIVNWIFANTAQTGGTGPGGCSYILAAVTPNPPSFTSAGGSGTATVTAGAGCSWTATSSDSSWLATASTGSGNGAVNYTVAANTTTSSRTGTLTIGGQTFTVTQAASSGGGGAVTGNLIVNGDAETGTANGFTGQPAITGWSTDGNVAIVAYSDNSGDLSATTPGPSNRGNNYFAGGVAAVSKMSQTIDVSSSATAIDGGTQPYTLEGWLGGWDGQDDNVVVQAVFLNASGATLATATIGPVLSADRGGVSELLDVRTSGKVPAGTRKVTITVTFTRVSGSANDGLVDDLYFGLTSGSGWTLITSSGDCSGYDVSSSSGSSTPNPAQCTSAFNGFTAVCWGSSSSWDPNACTYKNIAAASCTGGQHPGSLYRCDAGSSTGTASTVYYRFENGTANATATGSGTILDSMGTGQNGTPSGTVTYSSDVPLSTVAGAPNALSLRFAANGSVQFPGTFPLNSLTNATLEFYIKPAGTGSEMDFLWTRTDSTDANRFNMGVLAGGGNSIFMDYREPNGTLHSLATIAISSSGWTHVAMVKSGNTWTSYANGVQQSNVTDSNPNLPTNTGWTLNGRNVAQFTGLLDELRISNSALTPAQFLSPPSAGACSYALSATSASPAAAQTTGTVTVTAGTGCAWTAASSASWITISSGASGTGNGTVSYSVAANTGAARTGTLTIAGITFTVSQAAAGQSGCSYNVSPTDIHATAAGLSNTVLIFTNSGCNWTASVPSGVTWITLSPASGSGGGAVGYSIPANTGAARNTTITVAGSAVTVEQDASSNCTYTLVSSSSPLISGVGGVGSVAVTVAGTSCAAWKVAMPPVSWVHVAAGSGSTSSGTVSYSVDSNTAASPRSTTLTIANQNYTVQQAAAPCTYALSSPSSGTLAAGGASGSFLVTAAGPACTWSITLPSDANSQWIHVISALSAMSSGNISYTVDPNNTTSARSLALTVNGKNPASTLTYTVSQAAGTANTTAGPIVNPNGIVNAASFISAYLPAGSIAQGSFFSIFGNNLGPPNPGVKATSYPLGTNLGGVSVKVTQGSTSVDAIPVFVAQYQINAVMPSNTPTGTVQVTVSYSGLTSAPAPVQVVVANFGAFTVSGGRGPGIVQNFVSATQLPLNMTSLTAAPGDYAVLWGTGLGPLPGGASDTQPPAAGTLPATVQVLLGNQTISPAYAGRAPGLAGVDQIDFQLPSNVTLGCYVPLQVVVNGNASNTVTMAINNNRQPCSDTSPFSSTSRTGGKNASIALARLSYTDPVNALKIGNGTVDIAMGTFNQSAGTGDLGFSLFASLPPMNTCTYYNNIGSLNGLLGGQMPSTGNAATPLDAGPTITVQGPNGTQGVSYSDSTAQVSPYLGVLGTGGGWTALGLGPSTPFLDTGNYTVSGLGGKDVGPFQYTLQIPAGATWTNRDSIMAVDRSKGLTVLWSGGNPSTQAVAIFGYSSNPSTNVSGGFACLSSLAPQSFTVPPSFLANLPATPATNPGNAISALVFATVPTADQFVKFSTSAPPSLDSGLGYYAVGELRNNVVFQ